MAVMRIDSKVPSIRALRFSPIPTAAHLRGVSVSTSGRSMLIRGARGGLYTNNLHARYGRDLFQPKRDHFSLVGAAAQMGAITRADALAFRKEVECMEQELARRYAEKEIVTTLAKCGIKLNASQMKKLRSVKDLDR